MEVTISYMYMQRCYKEQLISDIKDIDAKKQKKTKDCHLPNSRAGALRRSLRIS